MNKAVFESILDTEGGIIVVMDNGDRYQVYRNDVEYDADFLRFDCGDEEYVLPLRNVHNVEIPQSDRIVE